LNVLKVDLLKKAKANIAKAKANIAKAKAKANIAKAKAKSKHNKNIKNK